MRFAEIEYPGTERRLEVRGARVCFIARPAAADAPPPGAAPVLLIPPLGRGLMHYAPNLDALAGLGPVVAYDPPGCGKTDKAGPALDLLGVDGQAEVALRVLEAAKAALAVPEPAPALVVGTSYGAVVALALAARAPALVGALALSDAAGLQPSLAGRLALTLLSRPALVRRLGDRVWRSGLERMFARRDHPALAANLELAERLRAGPDWPDYAAALARTTAAAAAAPSLVGALVDEARARARPSAVIWGAHDRVTPPAWGRELASRLAAPFVPIEGAGHFPNIERPREFEAAVARLVATAAPDRPSRETPCVRA